MQLSTNNLAVFGTGGITLNGGTFQWLNGITTDISTRTITFGSASGTFDVNSGAGTANSITLAHAIGNANRSARVERPFWFIENNFLAGRTFASWEELNRQARQWCDKVNSTYKKHIRAVPRELFVQERPHLRPLPAWIPEVYRLHQRTVDVEGYVSVNSIRYSVPFSWIGRRVEVRETRDKIDIELDARHIVTHDRALTPLSQRITLAEHKPPRGEGVKRNAPHPEETVLVEARCV